MSKNMISTSSKVLTTPPAVPSRRTGVFSGCLARICLAIRQASVIALIGMIWPAASFAQAPAVRPNFPTTKRAEQYVPGRLLVRFRPNVSTAAKAGVHADLGSTVRARFQSVRDLELVDLAAGKDVFSAIREYRQRPDVLYAEPDFRVYATDNVPNDPLFSLTWGLRNLGDQNGVAGADIRATLAWQLSTGSPSVVVGQLDTGVNYNHPDLAANIFQNTPECNSNGFDNDGNGYINDCHGINLVGDGSQNDPFDYIGHGTHTAGTMGALGNNGIGVAGVNWQVAILPCKFIGFDGGTASAAIQCLDYMVWMKEHGTNIVATNNSWGGRGYSQALYDAIEGQMREGILFIAAAGNGDIYDNSSDNDVNPVYPAAYDLPNIVTVAATDRRDNLAWFSNVGRRSVHLGAPGVSVVSTMGEAYQELSGTSMATPHVTGSAALLEAFNPSLDWIGIKNLMMAGGDTNPNLLSTVSQNRLNVYGAMTCSNRTIEAREEPRNNLVTISANTPLVLRELNINCAAPAGPVQVTVQPSGGTIALLDDGNGADLAANDGVYSGFWTPPSPGSYTLTFPGGDIVTVDVLVPYSVRSVASTYVTIAGTNLNLNDETSKPIDTPFPIRFGGQTFSRIYATDNGLLTFDSAFNFPIPYPLPEFETGALIAPFWYDLFPMQGGTSNVYWDTAGTAPNRELIVEWRNVAGFPFTGPIPGVDVGSVTFEVVLHENSDEVDFNYGALTPGAPFGTPVAPYAVWIQVGPLEGTPYDIVTTPITSGTSLAWLPTTSAAPDFTLAVDTLAQLALPNQTATFTGTVTPVSGFASPVTVSCAGSLPPTCTPDTVAALASGSPFEVQVSSPTVGSYNFQLSAESDDAPQNTHQHAVTLNVVDYAISVPSPQTLAVPDGGNATFSVNLSASGAFNVPVTLSCEGLPVGAACSFSPGKTVNVTAGTVTTVTAVLTVSPGTPVATYSTRVIATAGALTETRNQPLAVQVQANPNFVFSSQALALESIGGLPAYGNITLGAEDGYVGTVSVGCSVVPAGPVCIASPASISSFPSAVAIEVDPNGAPAGTYQFTLTATDSVRVQSIVATYRIENPAVPFSFFLGQRTEQTVLVGNTTAPFDILFVPSPLYSLTTKIIPWTCNPAGAICNITPGDTFTPSGSPVHLQMTVTVPVQDRLSLGGTFSFTAEAQEVLTGTMSPLSGTVFTIHVQDFALGVTNSEIQLAPGTSTQLPVTYNAANGFNFPVTVACPSPLPASVTCSLDKTTLNPGDVALFTFTAGADATPSLRQWDIVGVATAPDGEVIQHTITEFASIALPTLTIDPGSVSVPDGGYANYLVILDNAVGGIFPTTCTSPDPGITCDGPLVSFGGLFGVTVRTASGVTPLGPHPFTVTLDVFGNPVSATGTIVMEGTDSLVMVTPNGGEEWSGGTQNIIWKYTGHPGATVRLDLTNGATTQTIAPSVPLGGNGIGSYQWQMPDSLPYGESYRVRVTSNDNPSITDSSDGPAFMGRGVQIHTPGPGSVIFYSSAEGNSVGFYIEYSWLTDGDIQFDLYKGGKFVQPFTTATISGCFDFLPGCVWDSPPGLIQNPVPGTDYSLKATPVADPTRAVFSSGTFTISNTSITLTSPVGGEMWLPGTTHAITWTWVGQPVSPGKDVEITLGADGYPGTYILTPTTPIGANGSGSFLWTIPKDLPPSQYYRVAISVFSPDNGNFLSASPADFVIGTFHTLSVTANGNGSVTSTDNLIQCPVFRCSELYQDGSSVTLTAVPFGNASFTGWSGACSGTEASCSVTMSGDMSVVANFAVPPGDLIISGAPNSQTVLPGQAGEYAIILSPQNNLNGTANLSCSGLPSRSSCSFLPNGFSFPQTSTSTLSILTNSASAAFPRLPGLDRRGINFRLATFGLFCLLLLSLARGPKYRKSRVLLALVLALTLLHGCGGSGGGTNSSPPSSPGTPSGTYTITVTAAVGNITRSTTVTLVVQ